MLDERKLAVLRAIVEDYVSTTEPVGSKSLVDRHHLDVSPATIRNDMAVLEEQGYIVQPHTSAGRVPTDKGYRLFVDRMSAVKPLSAAERRAIETFLAGAYDLDDVVMRTVRLLAQLTRQVAVVQYPSLTRSAVRHVELVPVAARRLMLVLITDTGRVEQRTVELPDATDEDAVTQLRAVLNACLDGRRLTEVASVVADLPELVEPEPAAERGRGLLGDPGDPGGPARRAGSGRRGGQPDHGRLLQGPSRGPRISRGAGGADAVAGRIRRPALR